MGAPAPHQHGTHAMGLNASVATANVLDIKQIVNEETCSVFSRRKRPRKAKRDDAHCTRRSVIPTTAPSASTLDHCLAEIEASLSRPHVRSPARDAEIFGEEAFPEIGSIADPMNLKLWRSEAASGGYRGE